MRLMLVTECAEFRGSREMDLPVPHTGTQGLFPRFSVFFRAFRDQLFEDRGVRG